MTLQLANIETAKRQNRLFDALKQGQVALKELQQEVRCLQHMQDPLHKSHRSQHQEGDPQGHGQTRGAHASASDQV